MSTSKSTNKGINWSLGAALGAALLASACCTVPLALVSLGIGGVWISGLTALAPYRWIFVALAVSALGYAGVNEWRMSRRPDCDCETALSPAVRRSLLGVAALAALALIVSPWLLARPSVSATQQTERAAADAARPVAAAQSATVPASSQQVTLSVEGMTCSSCAITVRKALKGVAGVYDAKVTYEPARAVVRFDPAQATVEDLTQATTKAGYPSRQNGSS
jgi:mercuric transport protein